MLQRKLEWSEEIEKKINDFTNNAENCIIELIKKLNLNLPAHPINLFSLRKIGFILKTILKNWSLSLIKIFLLVGFVEVIEQC